MAELPYMSKAQLVETLRAERARWEALIAQLDEQALTQEGVDGDWSIKDVIAHLMGYEKWMASNLNPAVEPPPDFPPELDASSADERNAWIYQVYHDHSLDDILDDSRRTFEGLVEGVERLTDEQINARIMMTEEGDLIPAPPDADTADLWPLWKWVADQSYEHYPQHIDTLRAWVEERQ